MTNYTIEHLRVTCQKCKHVFNAQYVANCPVALSAASMKEIRCEKCFSDKCGLGGNFDDAPPITDPIASRVWWWSVRGERGTSSNTIFHAIAGGDIDGHSTPADPDDFRRCHQLLTLLPEWRQTLSEVTRVYPYWKPFIDRWSEMEALYAVERPTGEAPRLYALMKTAERESRAILAGAI